VVCESAGMLIVMSGLPGAGKSAVAGALGRVLPAAVVEVDPVEAAMWRAGVSRDQPTGPAAYLVAVEGFEEPTWESVERRRHVRALDGPPAGARLGR